MDDKTNGKQYKYHKFPCLAWHAYILIVLALLGFVLVCCFNKCIGDYVSTVVVKAGSVYSFDKIISAGVVQILFCAALILLLVGGVVILVMNIYQQIQFAFYCRENCRQETPTENGSKNEISDEEKKRRQDYEENRTAFADYAKMLELAKVKTKTITGEGDKKVEVQEEKIDTNILKEILEKKPTEKNKKENNTGTQTENQ
ncbi:MAG TPA: hypothetical protein PKW80_10130 [Bacteroidales bacterium]|mgnify:CR=1 FL=1|nr:hypothetical protein [Bacteroidales bacterium]